MSLASDASDLRLPLGGLRVLVTRAAGQASELAELLRVQGATSVLIPTIEIGPPVSYAGLDDALAALDDFDLLIFTSANAVEAFDRRAKHRGVAPSPSRVAVVGPATARAVEAIGLRVDVIPPIYTAESLAETLRPEAAGRRILLILGEQAPPMLTMALESAGALVTVALAYGNRLPEGSLKAMADLFAEPASYPDSVTFTSASTARNLAALLQSAGLVLPESVVRASIGPITSRAMNELGLAPHLEAKEPTIAALVEALAVHMRNR